MKAYQGGSGRKASAVIVFIASRAPLITATSGAPMTHTTRDNRDMSAAGVFTRLRDLNKADQTAPVWKPACSGTGERPYSVVRRTPGEFVPVEYDDTANGNIRHYTLEGAVERAETLNLGGAR